MTICTRLPDAVSEFRLVTQSTQSQIHLLFVLKVYLYVYKLGISQENKFHYGSFEINSAISIDRLLIVLLGV